MAISIIATNYTISYKAKAEADEHSKPDVLPASDGEKPTRRIRKKRTRKTRHNRRTDSPKDNNGSGETIRTEGEDKGNGEGNQAVNGDQV